jgi:UDP-N-acetylmuramyl pentapeptide synthase
MRTKWLVTHAVDQIRQSIALCIQIGCIDLSDITGEDDFTAFPGTRDDGFDFVRGEVLCDPS